MADTNISIKEAQQIQVTQTNQAKFKNLNQIERELTILIEADKKNWTHFYVLMKQIEEQELWKGNHKSFSQWVKNFCMKTKTHESIIWNRKKAGKVYDSYVQKQKEKGIEVPAITDVKVSADSLVILDKINKYDEDVASELTERVMEKNDITKKELSEIYKSIRPEVHKISNNPHLKKVELQDEAEDTEDTVADEGATGDSSKNVNQKLTANKIVNLLCRNEWISDKKTNRKYFKSSFENNKYRAFTEFPVYTGTSRKSRRMDMLICENLTTENTWDLNIHCIEIKVSKSDLVNDHKYTEYADFVDYMWLAIPKELVDVAKENKFKGCGIIAVDINGKKAAAKIIQEATKLKPLSREVTLQNIALKMI